MTKPQQLPALDVKLLDTVRGGIMSEAELRSTLPKELWPKRQ